MKPVYRSNLFALIVILGQIIGSLFLSGFLYEKFSLPQVLVLSQIIFLAVPITIYFIITRQPIRSTLRLNSISLTDIVLIVAIAFLSQPVASFLSALTNTFFHNTVNDVMKELNSIPYVTQLGIIALTPAICEELTMRGIVLTGYRNISNSKTAVMTGLIFGILHLNPQQFLYAFVLGILFAYLVRITDSIFASVICHFTFNGIQVTNAYVLMKLKPELINDTKDFTAMTMGDKMTTLLPLFFTAVFFGWIVILLVKKLGRLNERRRMGMNTNKYDYIKDKSEQNGYQLTRQTGNTEEKVVNAPFIAAILVSVIFMTLVEIFSKR